MSLCVTRNVHADRICFSSLFACSSWVVCYKNIVKVKLWNKKTQLFATKSHQSLRQAIRKRMKGFRKLQKLLVFYVTRMIPYRNVVVFFLISFIFPVYIHIFHGLFFAQFNIIIKTQWKKKIPIFYCVHCNFKSFNDS